MSRHALWLPLLLLPLVLSGCKPTTMSRTYAASYDATWNAALASVSQLTGKDAKEADKATGRIVTPWATSAVEEADKTDTTQISGQIVHAVINVARRGSGTRVTVSVEERTADQETGKTDVNLQGGGVQFPVNSRDTTWPKTFLDQVGSNLQLQR